MFLLDLQEEFKFIQGQHLTLKSSINGKEERRSYSLCSSPNENKWKVAVKKINGGVFSTFVNENLKKGDFLDLMPPNGEFFTTVNPTKAKNYIVMNAR